MWEGHSSSFSTGPWQDGWERRERYASSGPPAAWEWPWSTTATSIPAITSWSGRSGKYNPETPLIELVDSVKQHKFGQDKRGNLSRTCRQCRYSFACHGECPKNRFLTTPDGEPGLNYLCAGYKSFFSHADGAEKSGRTHSTGLPASRIMGLLTQEIPAVRDFRQPRPQRTVSLRQRPQIQEMSWRARKQRIRQSGIYDLEPILIRDGRWSIGANCAGVPYAIGHHRKWWDETSHTTVSVNQSIMTMEHKMNVPTQGFNLTEQASAVASGGQELPTSGVGGNPHRPGEVRG